MTFLLCNDCGSSKIENRDLGLCSSCNKARRDKENAKPKIIKAAKKVSEKRANELLEYPKKKKVFLEFKQRCELNFVGCTKKSTHVHHCSLLAKNFLNEKTWKGTCFNCHSFVETKMSAEERREKGLLTD